MGTTPLRASSSTQLRLRYPGTCVRCGATLAVGTWAMYDRAVKAVHCLACQEAECASPLDPGVAGASALREYQRRKAAREARVKERAGSILGGFILAVTDEPQSTIAWERGASGEQKLANELASVEGIRLLNDRRVPGTKGNIDHIVISRGGVFVIDAKHYKGVIRVRDCGGLLNSEERLFIGRRDCSELATNMGWQVQAVHKVLSRAGDAFSSVPIRPVLCFIDGEWPLFSAPKMFRGVHLSGPRSIKKLITGDAVLREPLVDQVAALIARNLPVK